MVMVQRTVFPEPLFSAASSTTATALFMENPTEKTNRKDRAHTGATDNIMTRMKSQMEFTCETLWLLTWVAGEVAKPNTAWLFQVVYN